ncbi:hypothetical protein A1D23_12990 [Chelonobacter oris]|uniref:DUF3158 family protein n=1 Tax=Chelonobacter oris TaxID=505317 RepID=UPI00244954FA|nr:DUF3158 family protein [Chelonobacter oris]MDH3001455.1 hypothetical protein [Chelonobacter oris]
MSKRGVQGLTPEDFQEYHRNAPVNATLRGIFKKIASSNDYQVLNHNAQQTRQMLMEMQTKIADAASQSPLTNMPIYLKKDSQSSAKGCYLRWRNCANGRLGLPAWESMIQDCSLPEDIRMALLEVEKDRICGNMQMSVLNFILRQIRECEEKLIMAEKLFEKGNGKA